MHAYLILLPVLFFIKQIQLTALLVICIRIILQQFKIELLIPAAVCQGTFCINTLFSEYINDYGIETARGQFIGFVDGDDAAHPEMFTKLRDMPELENTQVAVCNLQVEREFVFGGKSSMQIIDGREATRRFLTDPGFGAFSCNKLFRASFLRNTGRYPEGMFYEDIVFIPRLCARTAAVQPNRKGEMPSCLIRRTSVSIAAWNPAAT